VAHARLGSRELRKKAMIVAITANSEARKPGFPQGIFLLLPITLAVIGVSVFTATVAQMQEHFKDVPNGDYLVNLLQTMPGFWIVAFSPVAGWLADKFGRRRILIWSMIIYAAAGVAPFFMDAIYPILVTRCLVGMCESVVLTVTTTMLCDYFKSRSREKWLASQTGVASLSALIIIPLGGILGNIFGWHGPFLVYLYSLLLVIFLAIFCWEPAHEGPSEPAAADAVNVGVRYTTMPVARMMGICAITVIGSVMFYSTITQNANAFVALGVTNPAKIGTYATFASLGVPIGTVLFWGLGRLHIGWLLFIDFLLIGIGFTWMSLASTPLEYVYAANVQQIGCGLILPTLLVWATRGLAYSIRGRGNGFWQGAFGVGLFVSGAALTFLSKQFNDSILLAFGALGKVCLVAAAIVIVAKFIWGKNAIQAARRAT
jgi:MFS family permease